MIDIRANGAAPLKCSRKIISNLEFNTCDGKYWLSNWQPYNPTGGKSLVTSMREFLDWTKLGEKTHLKYKPLGPGTEWRGSQFSTRIHLSLLPEHKCNVTSFLKAPLLCLLNHNGLYPQIASQKKPLASFYQEFCHSNRTHN